MGTISRNPTGATYRICASTGVLPAALAAATATAGHIGAFRWTSATKICLVQKVRAVWTTETGPTAAQLVGMDIVLARSYSASHSGGTDLATAPIGNLRSSRQAASAVGDMRLSATTALTAGTHTLDVNPQAIGRLGELAAGAGVYTGSFAIEAPYTDGDGPPLELRANEGLVLRNLVLLGTAITARVVWTIDWAEASI